MDAAKDFIVMFLSVMIAAMIVAFTFKIVKPATEGINTGLTGMQNNLNQMSEMEFSPYDQQTLKGTSVEAAIRLYKDRDIAVWVYTKGEGKFLNYGAITDSDSEAGSGTTLTAAPEAKGTKASVDDFKNNTLEAELVFDEDSGEVVKFKDLKNINRKTSKEYINPNADFQAVLIHNANGGVVGIALKQTGTNK